MVKKLCDCSSRPDRYAHLYAEESEPGVGAEVGVDAPRRREEEHRGEGDGEGDEADAKSGRGDARTPPAAMSQQRRVPAWNQQRERDARRVTGGVSDRRIGDFRGFERTAYPESRDRRILSRTGSDEKMLVRAINGLSMCTPAKFWVRQLSLDG